MIRLAVALPAFGSTLDVGHAGMWLGLGAALAEARSIVELVSFANYSINGIDLAREVATFDALKAGASWLLMADADTYHAGTTSSGMGNAGVDILQMIRDADRGLTTIDGALARIPGLNGRTVGLVGAPVRGRGIGATGVTVLGDHGGSLRKLDLEDLADRMTSVARIGGAFIAINLGWLRTNWPQPPWFKVTLGVDETGKPVSVQSEDNAFCEGVLTRGGAVVCDGRFVPEHVARRKLVGEI